MIKTQDEFVEGLDWLCQHGFPSFDEFRSNPDKYRKRPEELFESADSSTTVFRDAVKKQVYMWKDQYTCRTLEELERIVKGEGFEIKDLEMEPLVRPMEGSSKQGSLEIVIKFWPRAEFAAMGKVVPNG